MLYLKIENPGVCPPEGWTLFGATTKRGYAGNKLIIGTFGSGNKHATCLLLRQGINPTIFCDKLKMSFYLKPRKIQGVNHSTETQQVCVKYGGKDLDGKNRSSDEELSVTLDYGTQDWPSLSLALREYVSNALDACFEVGMNVQEARCSVVVKIVDESEVRAKSGYTRVFVPLTQDVQLFYSKLGKWFLHFFEPDLVTQTILPKANRNVSVSPDGVPSEKAVIYRRGVYVREFTSSSLPSLFDYNLSDLKLNESRTASDWDVKHDCGEALSQASAINLSKVFSSMKGGKEFWEFGFDSYSLTSSGANSNQDSWNKAFEISFGENGVLVCNDNLDVLGMVERKGFTAVQAKDGWAKAGEGRGLRTEKKVLSEDDLEGRVFSEATQDVKNALDWVWSLVEKFDMTNNKTKPEAKCFHKHMVAGSQNWGLYKDGTVFIHTDISTGDSDFLRWCMWEEVAHHITGATDMSRDFQTWLIRFLAKMGGKV